MDATLIVESWRESSERVVPLVGETSGEISIGGPSDDVAVGEAGPLAIVSWRDGRWRVRPCSPHVRRCSALGFDEEPLLAEAELRHGDAIVLGDPDDRPARVQVLIGERARVLDEHRHVHTVVDPLTNMLNRRALMTRLARLRPPACLLMIDIDWMKKINDSYGFLGGDTTLRVTSRRIRELVTWPSCVARLGGEEFVVVMPGELVVGLATAEAIRAACEPGFLFEQITLVATVSIGVASMRGDVFAALRDADEAMIAAKAAGRNRVVAGS